MKYSLRLITIALSVALFVVPVTTINAQTTTVERDTSLFGSLRERQIANRQKIKTNLRDLVAEETAVDASSNKKVTAQPVVENPVLILAHRLQNIADRLEGHMLLLESQNAIVSSAAKTAFIDAQMNLLEALDGMNTETLDQEKIAALLQDARAQLSVTVAELKTTVE